MQVFYTISRAEYYFTAIGNCLYMARRIGGTLRSILHLMRQERIKIKDDAVGIVAPVYAVEMPMTAMVMLYSHTFFN